MRRHWKIFVSLADVKKILRSGKVKVTRPIGYLKTYTKQPVRKLVMQWGSSHENMGIVKLSNFESSKKLFTADILLIEG